MLKTEEPFTYEQYLTWPDDERWELIDGQAFAMGPALQNPWWAPSM